MATCVNFGTQQYFGFDPRTIPGCGLWFDAADTTTITGTTTVTAWVNKGTLSTTATNFSGSCTSGNTLNGLNFVRCPVGTNLRFTTALATQARSWFLVGRVMTQLSSGVFAGPINQTAGAGQDAMVFAWISPGVYSLFIGPAGIAINVAANMSESSVYNTPFIASIVNSTTTASNVLALNGTPLSLTGSAAAANYNTGNIAYSIGTAGYNTAVDIMEVIFYYGDVTGSQRQQVEGYLAWKWGLQANLATSHPFKGNRPAMRLFQPVDIPGGALLWLDAADTRTITGTTVTQWTDKSGRGSNAVTGLGSVVAGTAINSRNTLRFGLNTTLNLSNFVMPSAQTSVFYVFRGITSNPSAGTGYFIFSRTADDFLSYTGNQQFFCYQNVAAGRSYVAVMGSTSERNWGNLSTTAFVNATNVISTTGTAYASSNGLSLPLVSAGSVANTVFTATTYQIGSSRWIGDVYTFDLGELIVCDGTLSTADAQQLEGYLAWKWGVPRSLPTTHPYYKVLPSTPLFVPPLLSNTLALWFDAADTTTITGTTTVTAWVNKGTLSTTATPLTGSCTSGNTVNGLNFVRCPAGTDLQFTAALATQARSWFFVARKTPALPGASTFSAVVGQPGNSGQDAVVLVGVDATTTEIGNGPVGIGAGVAANAPSATLANVFVGALIHSVTTSLNRLTVNGTALTPLVHSSVAASYNTNSLTYLLGGRAGYNQSIDLMEVIFYYGDVTESQRQRVEGYLSWKWGLQSKLPDSHPYYKVRP